MFPDLKSVSLTLYLRKLTVAFVAIILTLLFVFLQPRYDVQSHHWRVHGSQILQPDNAILTNFSPPNVTRVIVAGGLRMESPEWFSQLPKNIQPKYYPVRDSSSGYVNKGHEAMFYLQYIIDHYDHLPDFMVFVHDHHRAWHNSDVTDRSIIHLLGDLKWDYVASEGFVNLRCVSNPNCPYIEPLQGHLTTGDMKNFFDEAWATLLEPEFGPQTEIAATCCAQFVVTRETVRLRSLEFYKRAKSWILLSRGSDWEIGRVFEYVSFFLPTLFPPPVLIRMDRLGTSSLGNRGFIVLI